MAFSSESSTSAFETYAPCHVSGRIEDNGRRGERNESYSLMLNGLFSNALVVKMLTRRSVYLMLNEKGNQIAQVEVKGMS